MWIFDVNVFYKCIPRTGSWHEVLSVSKGKVKVLSYLGCRDTHIFAEIRWKSAQSEGIMVYWLCLLDFCIIRLRNCWKALTVHRPFNLAVGPRALPKMPYSTLDKTCQHRVHGPNVPPANLAWLAISRACFPDWVSTPSPQLNSTTPSINCRLPPNAGVPPPPQTCPNCHFNIRISCIRYPITTG